MEGSPLLIIHITLTVVNLYRGIFFLPHIILVGALEIVGVGCCVMVVGSRPLFRRAGFTTACCIDLPIFFS